MIGIQNNALYWTDLLALRCVKMPDTFGAFIGVYVIIERPFTNGIIRAFRFAANNIKHFAFLKNNTVGTTEIKACGDDGLPLSTKREISYL
jgi:hypothetical protein